jgi:tryptophanyl-tRNA synthetase
MTKNILTGLQATGKIHLGNYLGAIKPMLEKQKELKTGDKLFMFIPDLHSLTVSQNYSEFYQKILQNLKIYLAAGLNPKKYNTILYRQSQISAHSELNWILGCFSYFGEISKMTQFKDKSKNKDQNVNIGLFTYPILMAADILLYEADYIPLGDDQKQHLELTRNLAIRFNNKFEKKVFVVPKSWQEQLDFMNLKEGVRIKSLQNPNKKMSKSVEDPKGTILLEDEPKNAVKKIMSSVTDDFAEINWDLKNQPGITNLLQIYSLLSFQNIEETKKIWTGKTQYGELKKTVASLVEKFLQEFQQNFDNYSQEEAEKILKIGEKKASLLAKKKLQEVQKLLGLKQKHK